MARREILGAAVAVVCTAMVSLVGAAEGAPDRMAAPATAAGADEGWVADDGSSGAMGTEAGAAGFGLAPNPGPAATSSPLAESTPPAEVAPGVSPESGLPDPAPRESVIGSDDRSRVFSPATYPSRAIGQLTFRTPTGGRGICTGFLVSPRLVLTSGHCVHNGRGSQNGWFSSVRFAPGRDGRRSPYGSCSAGRLATLNGWFDGRDPVYDLGAIRLNCSMGNTVGWLGFVRHRGLNATTRMPATVRGYPGDRAPSTMWTHSGRIAKSQTKSLFYRMDTANGQSGAPVYAYQDPPGNSVTTGAPLGPGWYSLAVHGYGTGRTGKPCACNSGPRITQTRVYTIADWIRYL